MARPILSQARTQTRFCRLGAAQNQGTASYWASPPRAQGVHAFVGWHFHPLGHYFEIRAQRSQRSCKDLAHHHHKIWVVAAQFATVEGFRTSSHISAGTVHTSLAQAAHLRAGFASSHLRKVRERGKTSQTYCNSTTHSLQPQAARESFTLRKAKRSAATVPQEKATLPSTNCS